MGPYQDMDGILGEEYHLSVLRELQTVDRRSDGDSRQAESRRNR